MKELQAYPPTQKFLSSAVYQDEFAPPPEPTFAQNVASFFGMGSSRRNYGDAHSMRAGASEVARSHYEEDEMRTQYSSRFGLGSAMTNNPPASDYRVVRRATSNPRGAPSQTSFAPYAPTSGGFRGAGAPSQTSFAPYNNKGPASATSFAPMQGWGGAQSQTSFAPQGRGPPTQTSFAPGGAFANRGYVPTETSFAPGYGGTQTSFAPLAGSKQRPVRGTRAFVV